VQQRREQAAIVNKTMSRMHPTIRYEERCNKSSLVSISIFTVESCGFGGCLQASTKAGMGGGGTLNFGGGGSNEGQSSFVFVSAAMELMAKAPRAAAAFSAMLHANMHSN